MCGIVGYIGNNAESHIFDMLKKLEYRGYDSAGIAVIDETICVTKTQGEVENLKNKLTHPYTKLGIGHTRWATHGKPNIINAHPHLSQNKRFAIVHNGIIENYQSLHNMLVSHGINLQSETDSEIIAALFELEENKEINLLIQSVVNKLQGSFAIAAIDKKNPSHIYLAKKKCPLYISITKTASYIASDLSALPENDFFYSFDDNEYALCTQNTVSFFSFKGEIVLKTSRKNDYQFENNISSFSHHMLEEIYQSPIVLRKLAIQYAQNKEYAKKIESLKKISFKNIYIIGCGTAFHSGLVACKYFEKYLKIPSSAFVASEFKYSPPLINKDSLCIFVSQSGETADTISCLNMCKRKGIKCISVVNSVHSTLSTISHISFPILAGAEIAVASTKAYVNQCAVLYILAKALSSTDLKQSLIHSKQQIISLANAQNKLLHSNILNEIDLLSENIIKASNVFFIGKNFDYITALEASLKLKEISYINCNAMPSGELKHGTLALIEKGVYVIAISTEPSLFTKTQNALQETLSRGANISLFTNQNNCEAFLLPKTSVDFSPILSITPLWYLAYIVSVKKGINPDRPRNLAKSVTVE